MQRARALAAATTRRAAPRIGFVAQEHPLHRGFTVAETLRLGRELNPGWDDAVARDRIERLGLPLDSSKVGKLSGGQQAQVALTLALAKRPELLLLDEPVASLDPLARREFLNTADGGGQRDRHDRRALLAHRRRPRARVRPPRDPVARARRSSSAPIDEIVASHRLLTGPRSDPAAVARVHQVIRESHTERQTTLLVRANGHVYDACWELHDVDLEEIVLAYLGYGTHRVAQREAVARMIWVGWRQQRTETVIAAAILAAARRGARPDRDLQMASAYDHDGLAACAAARRHRDACQPGDRQRSPRASSRSATCIDWFTLVPGHDRRAARGAVDQPARARHLPARLDAERSRAGAGSPASSAWRSARRSSLAVALTLLITWWRAPFVHLQGRMENSVFDSEGIVVFGYTLFALGLAAAVGVVWRRAVPGARRRLRRLLRRAAVRRHVAAPAPRRPADDHLDQHGPRARRAAQRLGAQRGPGRPRPATPSQ